MHSTTGPVTFGQQPAPMVDIKIMMKRRILSAAAADEAAVRVNVLRAGHRSHLGAAVALRVRRAAGVSGGWRIALVISSTMVGTASLGRWLGVSSAS